MFTLTFIVKCIVFVSCRSFIEKAQKVLRHSAGNFYINDRSTGSVVGQQPFGGTRGSGTFCLKNVFTVNFFLVFSELVLKESLFHFSTFLSRQVLKLEQKM